MPFIVGLSDGEPVIKFISEKASDGSDPDKSNEFKIVAEGAVERGSVRCNRNRLTKSQVLESVD